MEPTNAPAPMAIIPAGEPKRGSSCMAAIRMPHTRNPAPVPIPSTERIRQTNGFHAPQINKPIKIDGDDGDDRNRRHIVNC